ncbi:ankyrin repeat domain-containing protein [archaeon]|nr:MAG: ankyrin repeat domain-containing protein [archaeon]
MGAISNTLCSLRSVFPCSAIGPTPAKQFRNAIIDRDEDKAISLYTTSEGDQPALIQELHPSKPFPSKKNQPSDSPLFLAAKYALEKLVMMLLEKGGDPAAMNSRNETCLHAVCSMADHTEMRAAILDALYHWVGIDEENREMEKVSLNRVDIDGNTAIHNAAANGLVSCVEKLVALGAIISIVNKSNITCCEVADENNHKELALMLELALVFQPEDDDLSSFDRFASDFMTVQSGKLILDTKTLTTSGLSAYVEECIRIVSTHIGWMNARQYRCRAEALLNQHTWDVEKLVQAYLIDANKVLADAKMATQVATGDKKEDDKSATVLAKGNLI